MHTSYDLFAGRYQPLQSLGQGAQGVALQARDLLQKGAYVALKIGLSGVEKTDRIIAEFERLRSINSPYIAPVFDLGFASKHDLSLLHTSAGHTDLHTVHPYLVSSWIQGNPLLSWVRSKQVSPHSRSLLLAHLTQAVHDLHRNGVIHGDLKPQHVLISSTHTPKPVLIDFGLALFHSSDSPMKPVGGTPGYIAPELYAHAPASPESDRFALGILLAQALTGTHTVPPSWSHGFSSGQHIPKHDPLSALPKRTQAALIRLLARDPNRRPQLDLVRQALLPADTLVQGWRPPARHQLPFLGAKRLTWLRHTTRTTLQSPKGDASVVLVHGPRGSGKSRALRQARWELQSQGHPALELFTGAAPWARLTSLGERLAALSSKHFSPPIHSDFVGDRAHWTHTFAERLIAVLPDTPISLFWDDLGTHPDEGTTHAEILALVLKEAHGSLSLWCAVHTHHATSVMSLFEPMHSVSYEIQPLTRRDLDPLLQHTFSTSTPLNTSDLDHAYAQSRGNVAALHATLCTQDIHPTGTSWITALASLLPQGLSRSDTLRAAQHLTCSDEEALLLFDQEYASGHLQPAPSLHTRDETRWRAHPTALRALPEETRHQLAQAFTAFTHQAPHLNLLRAALLCDKDAALRAWTSTRTSLVETRATERTLYTLEVTLPTLHHVDALDLYVETALDLGKSAHAEHVLQQIEPTEPSSWKHSIQLARARLLFAQGSFDEALAQKPDEISKTPSKRAWWALLSAWIDLRRGEYQQALERAHNAVSNPELNTPQLASLRADLWGCVGAAAAFLGEDQSRDALQTAHQALEEEHVPPRTRARYHAMCAIAATMRGDLDQARDAYRSALEIVETHSLGADKPLYLLNLGTSYERRVQLSAALQYYQRGSRACLPTTRASTRALLLANCANVDIKLGRALEAYELLDAAHRIAERADLRSVLRFIQHVRADAEASLGNLHDAEAVYARCAREYEEHGDRRHACELSIKAGLVAVRRGAEYTVYMDAAQKDCAEFPDLIPSLHILESERDIRRGGLDTLHGLDRFVRALERALDQGDDLEVLTQSRFLAQHIQNSSLGEPDPLLRQELQSITGRAWRRVGLGLTIDVRTDLFEHLALGKILPNQIPPPTQSSWVPDVRASGPFSQIQTISLPGTHERGLIRKFFRLLSIGRKILGEYDLDRLIPSALDIALELSEAERGFLFLRPSPSEPFGVAFSRDLDGQPIPTTQLDVSQTIAREVVEHGETIATAHAPMDQRFAQAQSVLGMARTSVLCTPIRNQETVIGCLYLDRSRNQEPFHPDITAMMRAFADQIAIALVIAQNLQNLTSERDQLARANARVEELLRDKEHLLLDLEARCKHLEMDLERSRDGAMNLVGRYDHIIGQSEAMRTVIQKIDRIAQVQIPVVLEGESGTGKELIASAIHTASPRRLGPFVAVNCGALTETLLESELFGHKKGAFTGASSDRRGLFLAADGGTLFLDEIGEMSLAMQVKLLRVLQERTLRPVGSSQEIAVDVRIVAATHRNLHGMVQKGMFRQDLFYRVATLTLRLPPLRERREDIPLLVRHLLESAARGMGRTIPKVTGGAVEYLMHYPWPGNIRQMENTLRAALALYDGELTRDLMETLLGSPHEGDVQMRDMPANVSTRVGRPTKCNARDVEEALHSAHGDRHAAADALGVSLRTLQRYLKKFKIDM